MTELTDDAKALLRAPNIAHLATTQPDGGPHVVPIWIAVLDDRLTFITGPYTHKAHNLERDPRVSISVADHENWQTMAHLRGRVVDRLDGDEAWPLIDRIAESYIGGPYPRGDERIIYRVEVDRLFVRAFG